MPNRIISFSLLFYWLLHFPVNGFSRAERGGTDHRQKTVEALYERLYSALGPADTKRPEIRMTHENKKVAAYYPGKRLIVVDHRAYDVCAGLGKDSLHALAFILGHELAHVYQSDVREGKLATHFLSYDKLFHATTRLEKTADIQGVFMAYLAGFRLDAVVPKVLDGLYERYGLSGKVLKGYPTFEERTRSAQEVLEISNTLIDLYESANYLVVVGKYEMAAACYEHILSYFQGRELYNNLGTMYLQAAFAYFLPETDRFIHPVEMDATTQLDKINKARGTTQLTAQEALIRKRFLEKALEYFQKAIDLDPKYAPARLNAACALNMMQKPSEALALLGDKKMKSLAAKNTILTSKIAVAQGIAKALAGDIPAAQTAFSQGEKSTSQLVAVQAAFNKKMLQQAPETVQVDRRFTFPESYQKLVNGIKLGRLGHLEPTVLGASGNHFKQEQKGETTTFSFGDDLGSVVSIIRFKNKLAPTLDLPELATSLDRAFFFNLVSAPSGFFLKSDSDGLVVQVDNNGKVVELAKVFLHR